MYIYICIYIYVYIYAYIYIYIEDIPTSIGLDLQRMVLHSFTFYHLNIHHLGNLLGIPSSKLIKLYIANEKWPIYFS